MGFVVFSKISGINIDENMFYSIFDKGFGL